MKLSLTLLALIAAADVADTGYGQASAQEPAVREPAEQEPAEQEPDMFQSYSPGSFDHVSAPVCLGNCPAHARCQNKLTGECSAPQVMYEDNHEYYGDEKATEPTCPEDSLDTDHVRLGSRTALWVGFGLLFGPAIYVWWITFHDPLYTALKAGAKNTDMLTPFQEDIITDILNLLTGVKKHRFISFAILFIASLAYLVMALGYGYHTTCDGRQFYYARYIDWFLTTPLILYEILGRAKVHDHEKFFVIFMDLIMVVAGLIASLVVGNKKWVFFAFSVLSFLPILYFLCQLREKLISKHFFFRSRFTKAVSITIITWLLYPVAWILSDGTNTLSAGSEAIWYTVLDVIAKSVLAYLLVSNNFIKKDLKDLKGSSSLL